jgi:hypothetical protein
VDYDRYSIIEKPGIEIQRNNYPTGFPADSSVRFKKNESLLTTIMNGASIHARRQKL